MAVCYNQIGSLTKLLTQLNRQGIDIFSDLNQIFSFRKKYQDDIAVIKQQATEDLNINLANLKSRLKEAEDLLAGSLHARVCCLLVEKANITLRLQELEQEQSIHLRFIYIFSRSLLKQRLTVLENSFGQESIRPFKNLYNHIFALRAEIEDKNNNFLIWVDKFAESKIGQHADIADCLQENNNLIYGAKGEEQVFVKLKDLSDDHAVINDYKVHLPYTIYDKKSSSWINSAQIDHLVIGPTGVFVIETKNWSNKFYSQGSYYSPVKQVQRFGLVIYILLNEALKYGRLNGFDHNDRERKIFPRNILLNLNQDQFTYIKNTQILRLSDLNDYIINRPAVFSEEQVQSLSDYLIDYR
jgi:hypothetical protein